MLEWFKEIGRYVELFNNIEKAVFNAGGFVNCHNNCVEVDLKVKTEKMQNNLKVTVSCNLGMFNVLKNSV